MIYGYCRISTPKQSIERQIANIQRAYPDAVIVKEVFTGTKIERPRWKSLLKNLRPGDTIVFDEVSRMSRNAQDGFEAYKDLYQKGISLCFLKEPHINTSVFRDAISSKIPLTNSDADIILNAVNDYLFILAEKQIMLAFEQSQKEVDTLRKRTSEGVLQAKLRGAQIGRAKGVTIESEKKRKSLIKIQQHNKDFSGCLNDKDTMALLGISAPTFYKYKKELLNKS